MLILDSTGSRPTDLKLELMRSRSPYLSAMRPGWSFPRVLLPASLLASDFLGLFAETLIQFSLTWYFLTASRNPLWIALLNSAVFLPLAAGGLFSGILVQRVGARRLILLSKSATTTIFLLTSIFFFMHMLSLALLIALALSNYSLIALSMSAPASRVIAFTRWSHLRLVKYNSLRSTRYIVAPLSGVTCAGLLVDHYTVFPVLITAFSISFFSFLVTLSSFPRDRTRTARKLTLALWVNMTRRTLAALRASEIKASSFLVSACLFAVQLTFRGMILPTEVQARGMSASNFSAVSIAAAALSVFGALIAPFTQGRVSFKKLVAAASMVLCGTLLYIGVCHDSSRISLLIVVAMPGFALGVLAPVYMSNLQKSVPPGLVAHGVGCANSLPMVISPFLMVTIGITLVHYRREMLVGLACLLLVTAVSMCRR